MSENEIKIISKEEYQDEESSEQKIIFDNTIFEQIKGKELDLSVEKVLEIPILRNWFKRQKEEYYVVSQKEHICNDPFSRFEQQTSILEKLAEATDPTTERHGHDGTSWARRTVEGVSSQNT